MKKITLLLISAVLLITSCDDSGFNPPVTPKPKPPVINPPTNPPNVVINLSSYRSVASSLVNYNFSESSSYSGTVDNNQYAYFDYESLSLETISRLGISFQTSGLDVTAFSRSIANNINGLKVYAETPISLAQINPSVTSFLSTAQINHLNIYFNSVLDCTDLTCLQSAYTGITSGVSNNSSLTSEQKILVLSYVEVTNEFMKAYYSGLYDELYNEIASKAGIPNGRIAAKCTIRTRDVLRAAVEGGAVGGVSGAIYGASGGTVVLPVVGTVTGGVGGAVFGFTGGFVTGAVTNTVTQFFWNCLMASPIVKADGSADPLCDTIEEANRNANYCNSISNHKALLFTLQHP